MQRGCKEDAKRTQKDAKDATTWSKLLPEFVKFMEGSHTKQQCQAIFEKEFKQVTTAGRHGLVQRKEGGKRGFYLKLQNEY